MGRNFQTKFQTFLELKKAKRNSLYTSKGAGRLIGAIELFL